MLAALFTDTFSIDWMVDLTGFKASRVLEELQSGLQKGELVSPAPGVFKFQNSEFRNQLRNQLTPDHKKMYRQLIFKQLVRDLPEDDEKALVLAEYLKDDTMDFEKADWLKRAGDTFRKKYLMKQASSAYARILKDISVLDDERVDSFFIETALKYSRVCQYRDNTREIQEKMEEAIRRAKNRTDESSLVQLELIVARCEWIQGHHRKAMKRFDEGKAMIEKLNDPHVTQQASRLVILFLFIQGRYQAVVDQYQKLAGPIEKYPRGDFLLGQTPQAGEAMAHIGQLNQGLGMLEGLRQHCREIGNAQSETWVLLSLSIIMLNIARIDEAVGYINELVKKAKCSNYSWAEKYGVLLMAYAYYRLNEPRKAQNRLRVFFKSFKKSNPIVLYSSYLLELGWAVKTGQLAPIPGFKLEDEIQKGKRGHNVYLKGVSYRFQAYLQKHEGAPSDKILKSLNRSIEFLKESGSWVELSRTELELARFYLENDEEKQGTELAIEASRKLMLIDERLISEDLLPLLKTGKHDQSMLEMALKTAVASPGNRHYANDLKSVLQTCNLVTGAERGGIFLLKQTDSTFQTELIASRNLTAEDVRRPEFEASRQLIDEVCQTGQERFDNQLSLKTGDDTLQRPIRSRICVPLRMQNEIIGVLYHDNRILNQNLAETNRLLLSLFSSMAALIIHNESLDDECTKFRKAAALAQAESTEELVDLASGEHIVGQSQGIIEVTQKTRQVAGTNTAVLILGETGVGKDLVAQALHNQSLRHQKPFIKVHCSALPESLITSELFGHEKGAFTGASAQRIGRFEQAHGGTLFLDEIGELPLEVQVRLLRVLQNQEFERVGSSKTLHSDFRLIAATNRDMEKEVVAGRFRSDLYFRINVFPILVPPLRERTGDITLLAQHFMRKNAVALGKNLSAIPAEEIQKLTRYKWPGNIRELQNVIERGAILSRGPELLVPLSSHAESTQEPLEVEGTLQDNERRFIYGTLQKTGWKVRGTGGAAEILGLKPSTLDSKIKKLKIERPKGIKIKRVRG